MAGATSSTGLGRRLRPRALLARLDRGAVADAWRAMWWSRLLVVGLCVYEWLRIPAPLQFVRGARTPEGDRLAHAFDGWPLQGIWRALFEPLSIWDGVTYVAIAQTGYGAPHVASIRAVFFPLYPLAARAGALFLNSTGAILVAAVGVSLACMLGALYLLHRLTELELGRRAAWPALLLLVFYPAAFVLGAPYTESLFLLLSIGAFYAARKDHWAWAGLLAALATLTRNSGVILLVPLAVLYLYGPRPQPPPESERSGRLRPRYPLRRDAAWLLLAPLALGGYMAYLAHAAHDPLAWAHSQSVFNRVSTTPWAGFWDAVKSAWSSLQGHQPKRFPDLGSLNVLNIVVYAGAWAAVVGIFRRLPLAYGLYVVPALILPLTAPWPDQPLEAISRYVLSLFPIFMWLGAVCAERRRTELVVAVFAAVGGVLTVQFASGLFAV